MNDPLHSSRLSTLSRNIDSIECDTVTGASNSSNMKNTRKSTFITDDEIKETTQKIKEERLVHQSEIDDRHQYVFEKIGKAFHIEAQEVEECVFDSPQIQLLDDFFKKNGTNTLIVYFGSGKTGMEQTEGKTDFIRIGGQRARAKRVTISDGTTVPLVGEALFLFRSNVNVAITEKNIRSEMTSMRLDPSKHFLKGMVDIISDIYLPLVRVNKTGTSAISDDEMNKYLMYLYDFLHEMESAQACADERVELQACTMLDLPKYKDLDKCREAAKNLEILATVEEVASMWMKQMMMEINEIELVRVEKEDDGPHTEVRYWKRRMTRFNSLLDQLKTPDVKAVQAILKLSGSSTLQPWIDLDKKVTEAFNEAQENVKFLNTIEKFCTPLYHQDLKKMEECIPKLIHSLSMIYVYSTHYNTFSNMTVLFVKITNQMITSCKNYITESNTQTLWSQEPENVIQKIDECISLNDVYQRVYRETRATMKEKIFDFSEMRIFGNFNLFIKRIEDIRRVISKIKTYSILKDIILEGKEPLVNKLNKITALITTKTYNYLDQRSNLFEPDYHDYMSQMEELHNVLLTFINNQFERVPNVMFALRLMSKFEKITIPELQHDSRYVQLFTVFRQEIEHVGLLYTDNKEHPPIERNMPPMAGRIQWARNLFRRLEEPMQIFEAKASFLFSYRDGQRIVTRYNKVSEVLIAYEILIHRAWVRRVKKATTGLKASLIIISAEAQNELLVNLDSEILTLLREVEVMQRMGFEIPPTAKEMKLRAPSIKMNYNKLQDLVHEYSRVMEKMPKDYERLLVPRLHKIDLSLEPGLTLLNWRSLNIETFISSVVEELQSFELLLDRAADVQDHRINEMLERISKISMIILPEDTDEPWTLREFLNSNVKKVYEGAVEMQSLSINVLEAVQDFLDILMQDFDQLADSYRSQRDDKASTETSYEESEGAATTGVSSKVQQHAQFFGNRQLTAEITKTQKLIMKIEFAAEEMMRSFAQKTVECVIRSIRGSLETLWRFAACRDILALLKDTPLSSETSVHIPGAQAKALFVTDARLIDGHLQIKPTIEEIQRSVRKCVNFVVASSKAIDKWSDEVRRNHQVFNDTSTRAQIRRRSLSVHSTASDNEQMQSRVSRVSRRESTVSSVFEVDDQGHSANAEAIAPAYEEYKNMVAKIDDLCVPVHCYSDVRHDREIYKLHTFLQTCISNMRKIEIGSNSQVRELPSFTSNLEKYEYLWTVNKETEIQEFMECDPSLLQFQSKFIYYDELRVQLGNEPNRYSIGSLAVDTSTFKITMKAKLNAFLNSYTAACIEKYINPMDKIYQDIDQYEIAMKRKLITLDDISATMETLKQIRENDIDTDYLMITIEDAYTILTRHKLSIPKDKGDRVEAMRYNYNRLLVNATVVMDNILSIQGNYRDDLIANINEMKKDVAEFEKDYEESGPMVPGVPPREASDRQILFKNRFDNLSRRFESYRRGELLFGLPASEYPRMFQIGKELDLLQRLYGLYNEVNKTVTGYYEIVWANVNMEQISSELVEFQNKCRRLPMALRSWPAYEDLRKKIDDFNATVPLLEMMTNKSMKPRHWQRLTDLTNYTFDVDSEEFTLKNMLDAPLLANKEEVEDICISAVREKDIEAKVQSILAEWSAHELATANFKNRGELLLKSDKIVEINTALEDSLMLLSSLMSNRYNTPFKKQIQDWLLKLTTCTEVLENWIRVQNLWIYLEAVFVGGDIAKQLPQEAKRFQNIDKSYVKIMERARDTSNVVQCCAGDQSLAEMLPRMLEQLELCQKSLTGYLEKKRLLFPRFFFVSDPVLLEILGQSSDSHSIQAHLLSVFDNIKYVKFNEKLYDIIEECYSSENELLKLEKPVRCEGHVETWLMTLLRVAQHSLHGIIRRAYFIVSDPDFELIEFLDEFPAQVGILGLQIIWTHDSTEALRDAKTDKVIMQKTNKNFLSLLNVLIKETTKPLDKYQRTKYETFITIHLHQRDIFDDICKLGIKSMFDFEWTKQTRTYFIDNLDICMISMTDVDFEYQNEFLGCTERLVITPLTDRCYITLAQALSMGLGGAPQGPAGTGKTETTKDMGRCLGKYVVVFNCSDQMDFRGLGRIFKGLAQSGSWGCFDEFNRIELPVLSVAAQQVAVVLACKRERRTQFVFLDGDIVDMNNEFGLFLTMNPGYAGRQELPENLKINFRPVAMMVPDRQIIIRVKLAACGFVENILLSRKFFVLYKLCEEQLTKQVHYDFGLRNILSVLRTLGAARRKNPDESEDRTVLRGLRDMNISKLVDQDELLFMSLIDDLFPGIILDKAGYPQMEAVMRTQIEKAKLIYHPSWCLKVIQLYETQCVRHGMMTLGPSGAGKTCCITLLMNSLTELGTVHREMRMNPKAITAPQMFGKLDVSTNDWTDGIFSTLWRRTLKVKKADHTWLILDGPVDAIWIENLNSVLDDNKTLTLANGDRIPMAPTCKIIFEVHNIDNASPATVSRNGMVFMSSTALNWKPLLQGWLLSRTENERRIITALFEDTYGEILKFADEQCEFVMTYLESFVINQTCSVLGGLMSESAPTSEKHYERQYIVSVIWSVGALFEIDDRQKLENFMRSTKTINLDLPECSANYTIFDYYVDGNGKWKHWINRVDEYVYPKDHCPPYDSILVPNVDNVRTEFLMHLIAKQGKSVLLIGESGSAKTVMISKYMSKYNPEAHLSKSLNFSSATTPGLFQRTIESFVEKRVGLTYGPPAGKKMTVFIDDINLPKINEWGDQIANEIVRQLMEMRGFYSLDKPGDFITIMDIQFIAAMNQPGGGRNDIPERLKRHFTVFNCTLPSNPSIDKIFSVIGCGYYIPERKFTPEVIKVIDHLVPVTRKLWQTTKGRMLPTPAKFHYVFNLRDLSRIWQGMIQPSSDTISNVRSVFLLWNHECKRVFSDRFVNEDDVGWFNRTLKRIATESFEDIADLEEWLDQEQYFVDFLRDAPEPTGEEPEDFDFSAPKVYEPVESLEVLKGRLLMNMRNLNETIRGSPMDLVFFDDAMIHLVRISRIIRFPRGNALLVGVGGSGKQSLTRLASYIAGYQTFQITLTRTYNVSNLLEDLKVLYRVSGVKGTGITFLFTDNEIKEEGFLEYLNNILASGIISNLFAKDELEEICGQLIPVMKKEFPRTPPTMENLYEYYTNRVKHNLHVVLCFSPVGEKFRSRALKFPSLTGGCTIDWFQSWPRQALLAVAEHYLVHFDISCEPQIKTELISLIAEIHFYVSEMCPKYFRKYRRMTHVTPKSYLSFLQSYKDVYSAQQARIQMLAQRMDSGLMKLVESTESVAILSKELESMEKELAVANVEAEKVLEHVMAQTAAAEEVKNKVMTVKVKCQNIVDTIDADRAVAEEKLELSKPALQEAEDALNTIKPSDISTVRKLAKPPHLIQRIMDCVLILFQRHMEPVRADPDGRQCPKPSWGDSLKLMSNQAFLTNLLTFHRDEINGETVELLDVYIRMEDYNIDNAKKVCGNVAGLLSWTVAMVKFYYVNREVVPLKDNLAKATVRLNRANADLAKAEELLAEKEKLLGEVREQYEKAMKKKQDLADAADRCRYRMDAATQLISGLGNERVRWTTQSHNFKTEIIRLVGDILVCTAFLSYSGPYNQEYRRIFMRSWKREITTRKIPMSDGLNVTAMLVDQMTISEWNLQGLPNDDLSIENGIIVTKASRFPLIVDPQGQGKIWIINKERENEPVITTLNNKYFRNHLEDALTLGKPFLIEDLDEELDPALDDILEKNFIKIGRSYKVKVGDKEVDIDIDNFRLYMTTKMANPQYTPEVSARTSIIDFTVTVKGLEDQLLGRVIQKEKEELEKSRIKLAEDMNSNKRKVQELEDSLLERLANTKGALVDDQDLLDVLNDTKITASEAAQQLAMASETEKEIHSAREEYRPCAARGSILYFLITEMSMVNPMYQTGLKQFLQLFDISMERSERSPITHRRIVNIIDHMTYTVWKFAVRGLYAEDKMTLTLLMTLKIDLGNKSIRHEEFDVLVKGGSALDLNTVQPKPAKWITDMTWLNIVALSALYEFSGIIESILRSERAWKQWFDKEAPEEELIPGGYDNHLNAFHLLLLIRSWCPDRTIPQARKYIANSLNPKFSEELLLDVDLLYKESDNKSPLLGLLSMGADPTPKIDGLAKKMKVEIGHISMGQGQEVHARKLAQKAMMNGTWMLLQNCHLSLSYIDELFVVVSETQNIHPDFRLWLTTEVHPKFPINFLQISIKFTNEPPQGIKASLRRSYADFTQDFLDTCYTHYWKIMLYTIAFLHTTVQERRKFGPLGWNIPYEFNQSDFNASVEFMQNHLDSLQFKKAQKISGIDWKCVRYMLAEIQYGGRVTDDYDKRLLVTLVRNWFGERTFQPEFQFHEGYAAPKFLTVAEYHNYIANLPASDTPEALGLHPNADITYQTKTTATILDTILSIQPKDSTSGSGETRESTVYRIAGDMLSKMPNDYVPHVVKSRLHSMGTLKPMNIFLRQEVDRMQRVIKAVKSTLKDLRLAIEGTIVMNDDLRLALDAIYDAKTPTNWRKISWQSATLGFWFTEMIDRNSQFSKWLYEDRPYAFWMTGFFNPQGFLTAMRQEITRDHEGWALDSVVLSNRATRFYKEDVKDHPKEGVYVYGLFLDGAGWDRRSLRLTEPKPKVLFDNMPIINIYAVQESSKHRDSAKFYQCPIYKKPNRTDLTYISQVDLACSKTSDHWVMRGVALLCDIK